MLPQTAVHELPSLSSLSLSALSLKVEALLRLRQYRPAMECLLAARERYDGFGDTADYQRCVKDVQAALEAAGPEAQR